MNWWEFCDVFGWDVSDEDLRGELESSGEVESDDEDFE